MKKIEKIKIKNIQSWGIFVLILLNIIVFVFFLSNTLYFRLDLTEGKKYSISKPTVELLRKLDNTMIIEYYYNDNCKAHPLMSQTVLYVKDMLQEYENSSKGLLTFISKELSYEKKEDLAEIAELEKKGIQAFALSERQEGASKTSLGFSGIIIKYKENEKIMQPVYQDAGFEYNLDTEVKKLVDKEGTGLGIIFAASNKTLENDYKNIKQQIESEYKTANVINSGENIPNEVSTILIIGGNNLTDYDLFQIDQFLMNGGKAFVALNGLNVIINPQYGIFGMPNESKLFDMLNYYGFKINKDMVGDNDSYTSLPQRQGFFVQEFRYPIWPKIKSQNINKKHLSVAGLTSLNLFWPSSIDIDEKIKDKAEILFHTTQNSWAVTQGFKLDVDTYKYPIQQGEKQFNIACAFKGSLESYFKDKEIPGNEKENESISGNKLDSGDTQLIVVSNELFLWDNFLGEEERLFLINGLDWLSKDHSLIQIRNKGKFSKPLDKAKNDTQYNRRKFAIIILTTGIVPILFIIFAIVLNFLRHLKNKKIKLLFSKTKQRVK